MALQEERSPSAQDEGHGSKRDSVASNTADNMRKRTKATLACNPCKIRRSKCTPGPDRCLRCTRLDLDCVYDEGADRRRRHIPQEDLKRMEHENQLLLGVYTAIRACPKAKLDKMMDVIRSHPLADVASYMDQMAEREELQSDEGVSPTQVAMSISNLVDRPLYSVRAKPWTTATDDDYLVSHLISLYFTWEHPFLVRLDQALFLQDMIQERSTFCSPLLVNAILAHASHMCVKFLGNGRSGRSNIGEKFSAEARRLWALEPHTPNLTTLQALLVMNATANGEGKDQEGWMYLISAIRISSALQLQKPSIAIDNETLEMRRARDITAWGLYFWQNIHNFVLQKEDLLREPPSVERPHIGESEPALWVPYPASKAPKPSCVHDVFQAQCSLATIISEVSSWLFQGNNTNKGLFTFQKALGFQGQLEAWKRELPPTLDPRRNPLPHVILLSLHFDDLIIAIFKPFIDDTSPSPFSADTTDTEQLRSREITLTSIDNVKQTLNIYHSHYGWEHCHPYMLHKFATIAFHDLGSLSNPSVCASFINTIDAIRQMSGSWFVAKPVLRMIELCAEYLQIELPQEVQKMLESVHDDPWIRDGVGQVLKTYPSGSFRAYFNDSRLEDLVDDWEQ